MEKVIEETATFIPNLPGVGSILGFLKCAETVDNSAWTAKTTEWPWPHCREFPLRVGVEYAYYVVARHNNLPMPRARVLMVGNELCWGTEILPDRTELGPRGQALTEARREEVQQCLANSAEERSAYLRMVFLDVFLFGADRVPNNILTQTIGGEFRLFYIDHDQSFGWRNDPHNAANNRILTVEQEYARIRSYTQLEDTYHWGANLPKQARKEVFDALDFEPALLDQLKPWIPPAWFPDQEFDERKAGLTNWWTFLKARPYDELDQTIFG